jgi:hypothetical protein
MAFLQAGVSGYAGQGRRRQTRLCARYRRLARTGKPANVVTAAIARELAGFVWAIALQVTLPPR